tara:strand:+ start:880 stop:1248 length:369 start_codon:yes stop_codon:yes gene_type:complete
MQQSNLVLKRIVLFLFGCMTVRFGLVYLTNKMPTKYLPYMGYIGLLPAIGFAYIYLTDSRKTGAEVFGDKIWWNDLRPIHSLLYFIFAYLAINASNQAYIPLLIDVVIGLVAFMVYHLYSRK